MDKASFANYLMSLAKSGQADLLVQEQKSMPSSDWDALGAQTGSKGLLGDDPFGIKTFLGKIANSFVSVVVIVVGLVLVGLAVNAWLNEQGGGVKVPVKLK